MHNDLLKLSGTCTLNVACCCTPVTGEDERDGKLMRRTSYLMATQKTAVLDEPADEHATSASQRWASAYTPTRHQLSASTSCLDTKICLTMPTTCSSSSYATHCVTAFDVLVFVCTYVLCIACLRLFITMWCAHLSWLPSQHFFHVCLVMLVFVAQIHLQVLV